MWQTYFSLVILCILTLLMPWIDILNFTNIEFANIESISLCPYLIYYHYIYSGIDLLIICYVRHKIIAFILHMWDSFFTLYRFSFHIFVINFYIVDLFPVLCDSVFALQSSTSYSIPGKPYT